MSFKVSLKAWFKGEVPQQELEGYRYATSQIDELERSLAILPEKKEHHKWAEAYTWVARALTTIASSLIDADELYDPSTKGYLPPVTFEQAKALYIQVPNFVHAANEAMAHGSYAPTIALPVELQPRIEAEICPNSHLKGILTAAEAIDIYITDMYNRYAARGVVSADLARAKARAASKLDFSKSQLAMVMVNTVTKAVHEAAENSLWEALAEKFMLGQLITIPIVVPLTVPVVAPVQQTVQPIKAATQVISAGPGRIVGYNDRWCISDEKSIRSLKGDKFGEIEIAEFWARKGGRITPTHDKYLAECKSLLSSGSISIISRWSKVPFDPIYQTHTEVTVMGTKIKKGHEFRLDLDEEDEKLIIGSPRFKRTKGYKEGHDEHLTDEGE